MWRRIVLVLGITLAGLGPVGGARAAVPAALAPSAPAGGSVGTGSAISCDEAALDAALAGGGLVTFNCGGPALILIVNEKNITQSTTLDGGGLITITGGLATRLFRVQPNTTLALRNIALDSGAVNGDGGGAILNAGALTLDFSTIQYSQTDADHGGGAIYTLGPVTLTESSLAYNTSGSGGALYASGAGARVTVRSSQLHHNHALNPAGGGGALWLTPGAELDSHDGAFFNNDTEGNGGAVYNQGRITSEASSYVLNQTTVDPLASFRGFGGGIASTGPISLTRDSIWINESRFGGGLYIGEGASASVSLIAGSAIVFNDTLYAGGGLYTSSTNTQLTIRDSQIEGNEANSGGGLARNSTDLTILRSSIGANEAAFGGGISNSAGPGVGSVVRIFDSTIYSNEVTSTQGGGIYNTALMDLRNLTLEGNDSGVFNIGSGETMTMSNSVLHNVGLNCDGDGTKPTSQGGNFSTDNNCGLLQPGDVQGLGLDPLLEPITSTYQAITQYFVPQPGSPLINTATAACSPLDQRRALRPDACDKGAVEYRGMLPLLYLPLLRHSP